MTKTKEDEGLIEAKEYLQHTDLSYYIPMNTCKRAWGFIYRAINKALSIKNKEIKQWKNFSRKDNDVIVKLTRYIEETNIRTQELKLQLQKQKDEKMTFGSWIITLRNNMVVCYNCGRELNIFGFSHCIELPYLFCSDDCIKEQLKHNVK